MLEGVRRYRKLNVRSGKTRYSKFKLTKMREITQFDN